MKKKKITCYYKFLIIKLLLLSQNLNIGLGQQTDDIARDKLLVKMTDNIKTLFYNSDCCYDPFVNGRLYTDYYPNLSGHQYLFSKVWEKGVINFKDDVQVELLINYDIINDKLLLNKFYSDGVYCIELNKNDIKGFSFKGHEFINVILNEGPKEMNGYYEVLYNGRAKLLLKWEKYISKSSGAGKDNSYIKKTFYIMYNNNPVELRNRKSIIYSLPDQALKIENYMRQNKFYVRTAEPDDFVRLLQYYDSL